MELCLMIEGQQGVSWPQWVALARACEQHGVSALMRSDHYQQIGDGEAGRGGALDAWATLSALAAITTTVRLGTMVSPATFRHPSVLARLVATADHVSGGRVELGIGAGWYEPEHLSHGFPFPSPRTRMDILEEQLQIIRGSWDQAPFSFEGKHYRLRGLDAQPKPIQPRPPIVLGGKAGPRSAALAARFADEYNTPEPTIEQLVERKSRIAEACVRIGREPIPFSVMTGVILGAGDADLRDRARRAGNLLGRDGDELVKHPPAGWIVGNLDQAAEQLTVFRDLGVSRVMCYQRVHDDIDAVGLLGTIAATLR